jgi:hypothetical protein
MRQKKARAAAQQDMTLSLLIQREILHPMEPATGKQHLRSILAV